MSHGSEGPPTTGFSDSGIDRLLREAWAKEPVPADPRVTVLDRDRYRDFEVIGIGGMGVVYLALDTALNRAVAVKVVRPPDAGPGEGSDTPFEISPPPGDGEAAAGYAELTDRFLQEAWLTGALEHPGIVPVYEMGRTPRGVPYYTMRYVKGVRTLERQLADARSEKDRMDLLGPFLHVCDAIRYAHSRGVIHRDLKPANIGIGQFGEVFVLDWGLAKMRDEPDAVNTVWRERIRDFRDARDLRTQARALGTPGYMSPEAAIGDLDRLDERSDVYGLGAILYQILTGRLPHEFGSYADLLQKLKHERPSLASTVEPAVSVELAEICARALSFEREERQSGAGELADALRDHRRGSKIRAEVRALLQEAGAAFDAAEQLQGDGCVEQLDRVRTLCMRVLERRADHARARRLLDRSDRLLKERADEARLASVERERVRHQRRLRRAAVAALALFAAGTVAAAWVFDVKRREAVAAERQMAELLSELGITERDRDRAKQQVDEAREARGRKEAEFREAKTEIARVRAEADRESGLRKRAEASTEVARARVLALEAELLDRRSALESHRETRERLDARLEELSRSLELERAELDLERERRRVADDRGKELGAEIEKGAAELAVVKGSLDEARAEMERLARQAREPGAPSDVERQILALASQPEERALRVLRGYAEERNPKVRDAAIRALGLRGRWDKKAVSHLLVLMDRLDEEPDLHASVIAALGQAGNPVAAREIVKLLRKGQSFDSPVVPAAIDSLGLLRTEESLHHLLSELNQLVYRTGSNPGPRVNRSSVGKAAQANREKEHARLLPHLAGALRRLTGLPFRSSETWTRWGHRYSRIWRPTPLALPEDGKEFRSEGWRIRLGLPDDSRWGFSRPDGALVRVSPAEDPDPGAAAWVEVRACSATETFPPEEGEKDAVYRRRRVNAAVRLAESVVPSGLREAAGAAAAEVGSLGGLRARKVTWRSTTEGTWRVWVVDRHDLLYTVTSHLGAEATDRSMDELEDVVKTLSFLDAR